MFCPAFNTEVLCSCVNCVKVWQLVRTKMHIKFLVGWCLIFIWDINTLITEIGFPVERINRWWLHREAGNTFALIPTRNADHLWGQRASARRLLSSCSVYWDHSNQLKAHLRLCNHESVRPLLTTEINAASVCSPNCYMAHAHVFFNFLKNEYLVI